MTDIFDHPPAQKKEHDRWGRYLLPDPITLKEGAYTRATTFAKTIMDSYALNAWQQRMTAKGLSARPDLVAKASTLDVKDDRDAMNKLVEEAKDAAGQKIKANLGTAIHAFSEEVDRGEADPKDAPENIRREVEAYARALEVNRLKIVPALIERVICVPNYGVAGKFDRVYREADGTYVIGDLKSGNSLQYGWLEVAIQLALYAQGINRCGVFDRQFRRWEKAVPVRTDYAVVMHVPAGGTACEVHKLDIQAGWEAAKVCATVRDWRKMKGLAAPYDPVSGANSGPVASTLPEFPIVPDVASWDVRFASIRTRAEGAALYAEAMRSGVDSYQLKRLADIGLKSLPE